MGLAVPVTVFAVLLSSRFLDAPEASFSFAAGGAVWVLVYLEEFELCFVSVEFLGGGGVEVDDAFFAAASADFLRFESDSESDSDDDAALRFWLI